MLKMPPLFFSFLIVLITSNAHSYEATQLVSIEQLLRAGQIDPLLNKVEQVPPSHINNPIDSRGNNLLHLVIQNSEKYPLDKVKILIDNIINRGGDLNLGNNVNAPSFFYIPRKAPPGFLDYLISKGADLNRVDKDGNSITHYLVKSGDQESLAWALDKADLNKANNKMETALMLAARMNRNSAFPVLLAAGADFNAKDAYGNTVAHYAAMSGKLDNLLALVDKGVSIDIKNDRGETPISIYASNRQWAYVRKLIEMGANTDVPTKRHGNLLVYLKMHPELGMEDLITGKAVNLDTSSAEFNKVLVDALMKMKTQEIQQLIKMGWDPNEDMRSGDPAIFWVVQNRTQQKPESLKILKLLVENGANINLTRKKSEDTPLIIALLNDDEKKVNYLLSKGVDKNLGDIGNAISSLIRDRRYQEALKFSELGLAINFDDRRLWQSIESLSKDIESNRHQPDQDANKLLLSILSRKPNIDASYRNLSVIRNVVNKMQSSESVDVLNSIFMVKIPPQPTRPQSPKSAYVPAVSKAQAKEIQTLKLSSAAKLHVIGVYQGDKQDQEPWWKKCGSVEKIACHQKFAGKHNQETISVQILDNKFPIVLSLMAYEPVHWKIINHQSAKIEAVVLSGYYGQDVSGIQMDVPVNSYTYKPGSCNNCKKQGSYFYTYKQNSSEYNKAMGRLFILTGKQPSSFQGNYSGRSFSVMNR